MAKTSVCALATPTLVGSSSRLPHGRPTPFEGDHFDNVFAHFRPEEEEEEEEEAPQDFRAKFVDDFQ